MSHFWAKFQVIDGDIFRLDTRIYLNNIDAPKPDDLCIGAVVGKNPGSAKPSIVTDEHQPLELNGDMLLSTVRNIVTKSYSIIAMEAPKRAYIQVLNLFYLCNPNLSQAITSINHKDPPPLCQSETGEFPWVWYVWGGESFSLDPYKKRFVLIKANQHFFFDNHIKKIKKNLPKNHELAKHTQGLRHAYVVPYIATLIKNN